MSMAKASLTIKVCKVIDDSNNSVSVVSYRLAEIFAKLTVMLTSG